MYRPNNNGQLQRLNVEHGLGNRENGDERPVTAASCALTIREQFKESWLTAIIGSIMFATGMCLLFWNEGRAVKIAYSLDEALRNVATPPDINGIISDYEGRLIYLSGPLIVNEPLTEPDYGIIVPSVKLKRRVQMFQWTEIEEEDSFGRHYYYTTDWKDKLIDSDKFDIPYGHENPKEMPIKSQVQIADDVKIGAYTFGSQLKAKFSDYQEITSDERPENRDIKMHAGLYYHSSDLWEPQIGDIRIQFSYAGKHGDTYTVVGMLSKGTILPFYSTNGNEILLSRRHKVPVDQIFHLEHVHNYWRTWTIRGLGWLVLFLAAACLANILKTIIINSSMLCGIISIDSVEMSVSMSISLLIIGFAWVWYRPIVGLCLALASFIPFMYSVLTSNNTAQPREHYRRL